MSHWLLVDLSTLAHRAIHSMPDLDHEDIPTGVVLGILEQLRSIVSNLRVKSNRVALFFDSRQSHRRVFWSGYKLKRLTNRTPEEIKRLKLMYDQIRFLREVFLPDSGFFTRRQIGLEADDLMASAANWIHENHMTGTMVTTDADLWQVLNPSVNWYNPMKKETLRPEDLWVRLGIHPGDWLLVKALAGCSSDGVTGIRGVGEKTAIRVVLGDEKMLGSKVLKRIQSDEGQRTLERNLELVRLPHRRTLPFDLIDPHYNPQAFFGHCDRLGLTTLFKDARRVWWETFFEGTFRTTDERQSSMARRRA